MRNVDRGMSAVVVAGVIVAVGLGGRWTLAATVATRPAGATRAVALPAGGADVLRVTVPAEAKVAAAEGTLRVEAAHYAVQVWLVPGARTVAEAVGRVGPVIVGEFKDFKAERTTDLTVAGAAAKRLEGPGHEADDGDDGRADVVVFTVGGRAFVACDHGETLDAAGRQGLLDLVRTARRP